LQQLVDEYLEQHIAEPNTIAALGYRLRKHVVPVFGRKGPSLVARLSLSRVQRESPHPFDSAEITSDPARFRPFVAEADKSGRNPCSAAHCTRSPWKPGTPVSQAIDDTISLPPLAAKARGRCQEPPLASSVPMRIAQHTRALAARKSHRGLEVASIEGDVLTKILRCGSPSGAGDHQTLECRRGGLLSALPRLAPSEALHDRQRTRSPSRSEPPSTTG
jgi:hypothetical protein